MEAFTQLLFFFLLSSPSPPSALTSPVRLLTTGWGLIPGIYLSWLASNLTLPKKKHIFNEVPVCRKNNPGWDVLIGSESCSSRLEWDHSNAPAACSSSKSWKRIFTKSSPTPRCFKFRALQHLSRNASGFLTHFYQRKNNALERLLQAEMRSRGRECMPWLCIKCCASETGRDLNMCALIRSADVTLALCQCD